MTRPLPAIRRLRRSAPAWPAPSSLRRCSEFERMAIMTTATSKTRSAGAAAITEQESQQVARANATGRQPVVFVHGLWLLPTSWDRWAKVFEAAGYATLLPGWPDDPDTVAQANAHPQTFAHKSVGQVADHFDAIIRRLKKRSEEHTSELQSLAYLVCRLLLEKKKKNST